MSQLSDAIAELQPIFLSLCKALVDDPEAVVLEPITGDNTTVFHLYVSQKDQGKIIGKEGRTAKSIRLLLASASMKYDHRIELRIHDSRDKA